MGYGKVPQLNSYPVHCLGAACLGDGKVVKSLQGLVCLGQFQALARQVAFSQCCDCSLGED